MKFTIAVSLAMSLASMVYGAAIELEAHNATAPTALAAPFAINIGENASQGNMVAWVSGQSKCGAVIIGPVSPSPAQL
jgi:hypothetical protein